MRKSEKQRRLLRLKDVLEVTGLSKPALYRLMRSGRFPLSIRLVDGGRSVAWDSLLIDEWLEHRLKDGVIEDWSTHPGHLLAERASKTRSERQAVRKAAAAKPPRKQTVEA